MPKLKTTTVPLSRSGSQDKPTDDSDGRRKRGERSRRQIIEAMIALIRSGEMHPSAAAVADMSGVSMRTVFRHFDDMDRLYREISVQVEADIRPMLQQPIQTADWRADFSAMIKRRAQIYEHVLPIKVAAGLRRFQSPFLALDHTQFVELEQAALRAILPASLLQEARLVTALDAMLNFETWRRMRQDRGLSPTQAQDILQLMAERLLPSQ